MFVYSHSSKMAPCLQLEVFGLQSKPAFYMAKCAAEVLKLRYPDVLAEPVICPLSEFAWIEFLTEKQKMKGDVWGFSSKVMCFINDTLIGDEKEFLKWAEEEFDYQDFRPNALFEALADDFNFKFLTKNKDCLVYMDISIDAMPIGRFIFELFTDLCPITCKNFRALCTGDPALMPDGLQLCYKGTVFHRRVKNGWIQGGDIPTSRGDGGESIFGPTFQDENYAVSHWKRGIIGMANKGRHTNGSQFYIILQPNTWMDTKYVAFGQLIEGTKVLEQLEDVDTNNERPVLECKITDCGLVTP
eukprot:gi/632951033/ref/XP_007891072.1/ PREDICTED: peptidyl-prolyl cis-trans isomerase-like 6 isoform X2 [Callorhinchus milii]